MSEIEKEGLRLKMSKTRMLVSGINIDLLKKSVKDFISVVSVRQCSSFAIFCVGFLCWSH